MTLTIVSAQPRWLPDCEIALLQSRLGCEYFTPARAESTLAEGLAQDDIYVALNEQDQCVGFIWFKQDGAFHRFPYLHLIAVKETVRGQGIGTQLLAFFEDIAFAQADKAFLVVASFNYAARHLYERRGYQQVGELPDLYKAGVTEYLMMKKR